MGLLGHTAAQTYDLLRVAALGVHQGAQVAEHPLLGVFPDGAGVDDDDAGLLLVVGKAEAHLGQIAPDALGVRLVLLTAIGVYKGEGGRGQLGGDGSGLTAEVQLTVDVSLRDHGSGTFHFGSSR